MNWIKHIFLKKCFDVNKNDSPLTEPQKDFWNNRYKVISLRQSGNRGFSLRYNKWYYKAKKRILTETLRCHQITIQNKMVADIGAGSGFFVDFYLNEKPAFMFGLDISERSIEFLQQKYFGLPNVEFVCRDIAGTSLITERQFHLVNVYDIMYLIADDVDFKNSLTNICSLVSHGGYLFLVDMFPEKRVLMGEYIVCRPINLYEQVLESQGLKIVDIVPQFFLFNRNHHNRYVNYLLSLVPWLLYFLDSVAIPMGYSGDGNKSGASFKLLVATRVGA